MQLFEPTADEVAGELEREARMRARVYPRWVEEGRIRPEVAERRIELMSRAAEHLRASARLLREAEKEES